VQSAGARLLLALEWVREQGMMIHEQLSPEQLERLRAVFANERPWSFELYTPLRVFAYALPRLDPPDPAARVTLGDCLTALNDVLQRDAGDLARFEWAPRHTLSRTTFAALGYAQTSAGIDALRSRNLAGWQEHARLNRAFLLQGAAAASTGTAALIGAGKLYDVPLRELAQRFERVILVDVDAAAAAASVEHELGESPLRSRVELVTSEVSAANEAFVRAADAIFDAERAEADCARALLALLHSYRWRAPLTLLESAALQAPLSAVFSTMVLTQLAEPLTRTLEQSFGRRFPGSSRWRDLDFQLGLAQFSHRIQHRHVQALLAAAPTVTVTSDVSEQYTRRDSQGALEATRPLALIGAPHLGELFPADLASRLVPAEWRWSRVVPGPENPIGRLLRVQGCLLVNGRAAGERGSSPPTSAA
jgi:hypothetical protein